MFLGCGENSTTLRFVSFEACELYILATGRHGMSSRANMCKPTWDEWVNDKKNAFWEIHAENVFKR